MCLAQGPQRSDAGEARTRDPSVPSQALYHWATELPMYSIYWADAITKQLDIQPRTTNLAIYSNETSHEKLSNV